MKGRITFACSDAALTEGFAWAKAQALAFSHEQDPVGDWYEAALPGRGAFCMRDTAHQARGAHVLGLEEHTKNMLLHFARSQAESRDFCCYWEIDLWNRPAPVDYTSDADFWYNLPANFDLLDACFRMYGLTGDTAYLENEDFRRFYARTLTDYIRRWDRNGDGVPEAAAKEPWRRGIPSYEEWAGRGAWQMSDLLSAEQKAFRAAAAMRRLDGQEKEAGIWEERAAQLRDTLEKFWWDEQEQDFYLCRWEDGHYSHAAPENRPFEYPLYFDAVEDPKKREVLLQKLDARGKAGIAVEPMTYLSEIFYRYGDAERGLYWLRALVDPDLHRRDYPEVSYAAVGDYVFGLLGVQYDTVQKTITVSPRLPASMSYAEIRNLPVFGREADVFVENGQVHTVFHAAGF